MHNLSFYSYAQSCHTIACVRHGEGCDACALRDFSFEFLILPWFFLSLLRTLCMDSLDFFFLVLFCFVFYYYSYFILFLSFIFFLLFTFFKYVVQLFLMFVLTAPWQLLDSSWQLLIAPWQLDSMLTAGGCSPSEHPIPTLKTPIDFE